MKNYLVFAWSETYSEGGGWKDFISAWDTLHEAEIERQKTHSNFGGSHIVDLKTLQIVVSQYEAHEVKSNPQP